MSEILTLQLDCIDEKDIDKYIEILNTSDHWPSSRYLIKLFKPFVHMEKVMEVYCKLCAQSVDYTHYMVNMHLIIKNSPNFISCGSTGLSTWGGSQWMLDFVQNQDIKNKAVVELGCGTGLLGIGCLKLAEKVYFTDCNSQVLDLCKENILLNADRVNNKSYELCILDWTIINSLQDTEIDINQDLCVVMADVIFDVDIIPDIIRVVTLFKARNIPVYMGYSIRNKDTFNKFMSAAKNPKIVYSFTPKHFNHFNKICSEFVVVSL
eukprot:NODE_201_length_15044_cov_0.334560.p3 type:complete len:265 gc:universal NODE_201_length_15044_cov_0.334560:7613-8407(+)